MMDKQLSTPEGLHWVLHVGAGKFILDATEAERVLGLWKDTAFRSHEEASWSGDGYAFALPPPAELTDVFGKTVVVALQSITALVEHTPESTVAAADWNAEAKAFGERMSSVTT